MPVSFAFINSPCCSASCKLIPSKKIFRSSKIKLAEHSLENPREFHKIPPEKDNFIFYSLKRSKHRNVSRDPDANFVPLRHT